MTTAAIADRNTAAVRKLTRNCSQGRVKTKNPMSRLNCGSFWPNDVRFSQSCAVCHCWLAADPANRARTIGTATPTSRRSGSMLSR